MIDQSFFRTVRSLSTRCQALCNYLFFLRRHMDVRSLKKMKMRQARALLSIYIYIICIHQYIPSLSLRWTGSSPCQPATGLPFFAKNLPPPTSTLHESMCTPLYVGVMEDLTCFLIVFFFNWASFTSLLEFTETKLLPTFQVS